MNYFSSKDWFYSYVSIPQDYLSGIRPKPLNIHGLGRDSISKFMCVGSHLNFCANSGLGETHGTGYEF